VTALGLGIAVTVSAGNAWPIPPFLLGVGLLAVPLSARPEDGLVSGALAGAGRIGFTLAAFALSFHFAAQHWLRDAGFGAGTGDGRAAMILAAACAAGSLGLGLSRRRGGARSLAEALLAAVGVTAVLLAAWPGSSMLVAVAANAALVGLAGLRIALGIIEVRRWPYWEGVALGAALLITRFVEIEHLLWLKGLGFIGCAAAVTWAAVAFERRRKEVRHVR
jgi:hypothetical protein